VHSLFLSVLFVALFPFLFRFVWDSNYCPFGVCNPGFVITPGWALPHLVRAVPAGHSRHKPFSWRYSGDTVRGVGSLNVYPPLPRKGWAPTEVDVIT
jgi:hypothetical protein